MNLHRTPARLNDFCSYDDPTNSLPQNQVRPDYRLPITGSDYRFPITGSRLPVRPPHQNQVRPDCRFRLPVHSPFGIRCVPVPSSKMCRVHEPGFQYLRMIGERAPAIPFRRRPNEADLANHKEVVPILTYRFSYLQKSRDQSLYLAC